MNNAPTHAETAREAELAAALAPLVEQYNAFMVAQNGHMGNQEDAYNCLARGQHDKWGRARAALSPKPETGDG